VKRRDAHRLPAKVLHYIIKGKRNRIDNTRKDPVVKVDRRIRWHYTTIFRLRIGARLTRYRNCKFHNFAHTISRHADGISRYSVPPSAGPLLPLRRSSSQQPSASDCCVRGPRFESYRGRLCSSQQPLRYTALGTGGAPLLQCLGRLSLSPRHGKTSISFG